MNTTKPISHSHLQNRYMLSVFDTQEIRWIRHPFMSKSNLKKFLFDYALNSERYDKLEIFMEPTLNINVNVETSNSDAEICTLRECLFGNFYQEIVIEYEKNAEFRNILEHPSN